MGGEFMRCSRESLPRYSGGMGGEFMVSMKQRFLEIYWKWLSKCSEKYFCNTQIQKSNPIN
jgi:hypothetical protein